MNDQKLVDKIFLAKGGKYLYRVLDEPNFNGGTLRSLLYYDMNGEFKGGDSEIMLEPSFVEQPCLASVQTAIKEWSSKHQAAPKNVLVLGVGGATIPRFLLKKYPDTHVVGIEKSQQIIEVAQKYFFEGLPLERFEVIHDDAIIYIGDETISGAYDIVVVDLYNQEHIVEDVFTKEFADNLLRITTNNALICFNEYTFSDNESAKQKIINNFQGKASVKEYKQLCYGEDYYDYCLAFEKR